MKNWKEHTEVWLNMEAPLVGSILLFGPKRFLYVSSHLCPATDFCGAGESTDAEARRILVLAAFPCRDSSTGEICSNKHTGFKKFERSFHLSLKNRCTQAIHRKMDFCSNYLANCINSPLCLEQINVTYDGDG